MVRQYAGSDRVGVPLVSGGNQTLAMTHWLPNRIMQTAALLCLGACLLVFWLVLHQPWLGMTLQVSNMPRISPVLALRTSASG